MKFREYLKLYEMPQLINDLENDDEDIIKKCEKYYDKTSSEIDSFSKRGVYYTLYKIEDSHWMVLLITDAEDNYFGYVYFGPNYNFKNSIMIQMTEIISSEQGQGIATQAYEFLLTKFDKIISDEQLTDGSQNLYKKLGRKYKKQIMVKNTSTFKEELLDIDFEDDEKMKPYANLKNVKYVISK